MTVSSPVMTCWRARSPANSESSLSMDACIIVLTTDSQVNAVYVKYRWAQGHRGQWDGRDEPFAQLDWLGSSRSSYRMTRSNCDVQAFGTRKFHIRFRTWLGQLLVDVAVGAAYLTSDLVKTLNKWYPLTQSKGTRYHYIQSKGTEKSLQTVLVEESNIPLE